MEERQRVAAKGPWASSVGYCRAVRVGNVVHVSGTAAVQEDGRVGPAGDAHAQAQRCIEIIVAALRELGAEPSHVVRTRMYVKRPSDWQDVGRAHGAVFGDVKPATTMVFTDLIDPDMLVEIEAEALL